MDQKRFNERIAVSLLRQCAWVWEHCTKNHHDGEFRLQDILQGLGKHFHKSRTGYVILDTGLCKKEYWDVFNVSQPIDGLTFDRKEKTSRMDFVTDPGLKLGFSMRFKIHDVFEVTRDFCSNNACQALMSKAVFFHYGEERYASLPELKPSSYKAAKPHTARRAQTAAVVRQFAPAKAMSLEDSLREALLERLAA